MTHAEKAEKLFRGGANCAQAVLTAFTDITVQREQLQRGRTVDEDGVIVRRRYGETA